MKRLCGRFGHAPAPDRPRSPIRITPPPSTRVIMTIRARGSPLPARKAHIPVRDGGRPRKLLLGRPSGDDPVSTQGVVGDDDPARAQRHRVRAHSEIGHGDADPRGLAATARVGGSVLPGGVILLHDEPIGEVVMIAVVHARREYGGVHRAGVRGVRRALTALLDGAVGSGRINGRHLSPAGVEDVQRQRVSEVLGLPLDLVLDAPDGYILLLLLLLLLLFSGLFSDLYFTAYFEK